MRKSRDSKILLQKQEGNSEENKRMYDTYKGKYENAITESSLGRYLNELENKWDHFTGRDVRIKAFILRKDRKEIAYFKENKFQKVKDLFYELADKLDTALDCIENADDFNEGKQELPLFSVDWLGEEEDTCYHLDILEQELRHGNSISKCKMKEEIVSGNNDSAVKFVHEEKCNNFRMSQTTNLESWVNQQYIYQKDIKRMFDKHMKRDNSSLTKFYLQVMS